MHWALIRSWPPRVYVALCMRAACLPAVCLPVCIYMLACLLVYLSICMFAWLSPVCLPICLPVYLPTYLLNFLPACLPASVFVAAAYTTHRNTTPALRYTVLGFVRTRMGTLFGGCGKTFKGCTIKYTMENCGWRDALFLGLFVCACVITVCMKYVSA